MKLLPIAMLLTSSSAMKIGNNNSDNQCLAQVSQDGITEGLRPPSPESVTSMAITILREVGGQLSRNKKDLEMMVGSTQGMLAMAGHEVGVDVQKGDIYDPGFVSDLIVAEYQDYLSQLENNRDEFAEGLKRGRIGPIRLAQAKTGDDQCDHSSCSESSSDDDGDDDGDDMLAQTERRKKKAKGGQGVRRGKGGNGGKRPKNLAQAKDDGESSNEEEDDSDHGSDDDMLAQQPKDKNPKKKSFMRTPRDYCMEQGPEKADARCQIVMAMPPPQMVLQQFNGTLNGLAHEMKYNKDNFVRDVDQFNTILMSEAGRLNVTSPKNGLPDPTKLVDQIEGIVNGTVNITNQHRDEALRAITDAEANLAMELANLYKEAASEAQKHEPSVRRRRIPTSEKEAVALGKGMIQAIRGANKKGDINDVYGAIINLAKVSKIPKNETPTMKDMQILVDGLLNKGLHDLNQTRVHDARNMEHQMEKDALRAAQGAGGKCNCGEGTFCNNDFGPQAGFCEPCAGKSSTDDCWDNGLPFPGAVQCEMVCFGKDEVDAVNNGVAKAGIIKP